MWKIRAQTAIICRQDLLPLGEEKITIVSVARFLDTRSTAKEIKNENKSIALFSTSTTANLIIQLKKRYYPQ